MAPTSDEAREHNQNLPGMEGVFNTLNLAVYHYGANNPLKYVDPDGREIISLDDSANDQIIADIILLAGEGFFFDENNELQIDTTISPGDNFNQEVRDSLISFIEGKNKNVKAGILYGQSATRHDASSGTSGQVSNYGFAAYGDKNGESFVVGVPHGFPGIEPGNDTAFIFLHEFFGHLVPTVENLPGENAVHRTLNIGISLGLTIPPAMAGPWGNPQWAAIHDGALPPFSRVQQWVTR